MLPKEEEDKCGEDHGKSSFAYYLYDAVKVMLKRSILHNPARFPTIEVCL